MKHHTLERRFTCGALWSALALFCASCSTTSREYVEDRPGFSVTKGRLLRVENLTSRELEPLADGVAFTIAGRECVVEIEFANGNRQELGVAPGGVLVCAEPADYVLRVERGDASAGPVGPATPGPSGPTR